MANLLVVEDDKELNASVCSYLVNSGYKVKGCFNGMEASIRMVYIYNGLLCSIDFDEGDGVLFK